MLKYGLYIIYLDKLGKLVYYYKCQSKWYLFGRHSKPQRSMRLRSLVVWNLMKAFKKNLQRNPLEIPVVKPCNALHTQCYSSRNWNDASKDTVNAINCIIQLQIMGRYSMKIEISKIKLPYSLLIVLFIPMIFGNYISEFVKEFFFLKLQNVYP